MEKTKIYHIRKRSKGTSGSLEIRRPILNHEEMGKSVLRKDYAALEIHNG